MIATMNEFLNKYLNKYLHSGWLRSGTLRYGLIALAVVAGLAVALPFVVPTGAYRDRIEAAVGEATGRALHIEGPLRLTLFPQFGFKAEKVTFANMQGGHATAMASVGDIRLDVHFWPLLMGRVEVDQIVLDKPVIALEVDQAGQANWMIGKHQRGTPGGAVTLPLDTRFSGIKISDGEISYVNAKSHTSRAFEHVNASVAITRLDLPVAVDGNLMLGGRRVDFDARLTTIKSLLGNAPTLLDLSLTSDLMQASFNGLMAADGGISGTLKCDSEHLRAASAWLGTKLPEGAGFTALSLETNLWSKNKLTSLSPLKLVLDHATITGDLGVNTSGKVPFLYGTLAVDRLDLNPYLATAHKGTGAHPAGNGWSLEPINLSLLKEANAILALHVGSLRLRNLHLGNTTLSLSLKDGLMTARLDPVSLYGGTGRATLTIDGNGPVPQFHTALQFDRIAILPFLEDTLGVDRIHGTGALKLDVSAQGDSAFDVMHTLAGKGSTAVGPGHIRGVDLGEVARTIATLLGERTTGDIAGTDFNALGGSFAIAHGVLATHDFHLTGALLSMTGAGIVDIGGRALDLRLVPKASVKGVGFGIPFRVKGSWDHVSYQPDLSGIANGVIQNLEHGRAPFKGLFTKPKSQDQNPQEPKKKKKSLGDALKNMLGIH
jgi:AsmA protein